MDGRQPPKRLGRYRVGAKIAGGGMATVYLGRARLPEGGDEVVALKVIKDEHSTKEEFVQMFLDEARILARLSHPNVIATVDSGVDNNLRFIAMELLLGRSLADTWNTTLDGRPFPRDLAAWVVARTADGLHYAHEITDDKGAPLKVIHRDVNPTNIFLTYDGQVKLIDFGLAKIVGRKSQSAEGVVKGKIPYLAPEQVAGLEVDRRVDVYGLGITLWELTTGRRLFKRSTDVATLQAIQKAEIPDARELVSGYPDALWKIVATMLEPDRERRTASAQEVAALLDDYLGAREDESRGKELASFLDESFPGERERQATWLRDATSPTRTISTATVPPPAPVPALLEVIDSRSSPPAQRSAAMDGEANAVTIVDSDRAAPSAKTTVRVDDRAPTKRSSERPRGKGDRPPPSKKTTNGTAREVAGASKPKASKGDAAKKPHKSPPKPAAPVTAPSGGRFASIGALVVTVAAAAVVLYALVHR